MDTPLKVRDDQPPNWDYDEGADVLYVSFGSPRPALALDIGEGVLLLYTEPDNELVGFTIIGIGGMLKEGKGPTRASHQTESRKGSRAAKPRATVRRRRTA